MRTCCPRSSSHKARTHRRTQIPRSSRRTGRRNGRHSRDPRGRCHAGSAPSSYRRGGRARRARRSHSSRRRRHKRAPQTPGCPGRAHARSGSPADSPHTGSSTHTPCHQGTGRSHSRDDHNTLPTRRNSRGCSFHSQCCPRSSSGTARSLRRILRRMPRRILRTVHRASRFLCNRPRSARRRFHTTSRPESHSTCRIPGSGSLRPRPPHRDDSRRKRARHSRTRRIPCNAQIERQWTDRPNIYNRVRSFRTIPHPAHPPRHSCRRRCRQHCHSSHSIQYHRYNPGKGRADSARKPCDLIRRYRFRCTPYRHCPTDGSCRTDRSSSRRHGSPDKAWYHNTDTIRSRQTQSTHRRTGNDNPDHSPNSEGSFARNRLRSYRTQRLHGLWCL